MKNTTISGEISILERELMFLSHLLTQISQIYSFNIQNDKEIFEFFHLLFSLISDNKLGSSSLSFLLMLLFNVSDKIKTQDLCQALTKELIEENTPQSYFYVVHGFFILNEFATNLKIGNSDADSKEIRKLLDFFSDDFYQINPIFLENYFTNQINSAKLFDLSENKYVNYFLVKIYNAIENIKCDFMFSKLERKKVLDFIENSIGIKKKSINLEFDDGGFGILEGFENVLKIQNTLISLNVTKSNHQILVLKNYFSIIVIKLVTQIKLFCLNAEKNNYGDFINEVEIYFNHLLHCKNEIKEKSAIVQMHMP